jgi:hypothetical protein
MEVSKTVRPIMLAAAAVTDKNSTVLLDSATQNTGRDGCAARETTCAVSKRDQKTHLRLDKVLRSKIATPPAREPTATRRPHPDVAIADAPSPAAGVPENMLREAMHWPVKSDQARMFPDGSTETAAPSP